MIFQRRCVHEFGHALGMEHGFLDPVFIEKLDLSNVENILDKKIYQEIQSLAGVDYDKDGRYRIKINGTEIEKIKTPFDSLSVMNYTFNDKNLFKKELWNEIEKHYLPFMLEPSQGDLEALKKAYP